MLPFFLLFWRRLQQLPQLRPGRQLEQLVVFGLALLAACSYVAFTTEQKEGYIYTQYTMYCKYTFIPCIILDIYRIHKKYIFYMFSVDISTQYIKCIPIYSQY